MPAPNSIRPENVAQAFIKRKALFVLATVLLLASCQSREDRMWRDLQTAIEMTQPQR